jgi:hypothetical protein
MTARWRFIKNLQIFCSMIRSDVTATVPITKDFYRVKSENLTIVRFLHGMSFKIGTNPKDVFFERSLYRNYVPEINKL